MMPDSHTMQVAHGCLIHLRLHIIGTGGGECKLQELASDWMAWPVNSEGRGMQHNGHGNGAVSNDWWGYSSQQITNSCTLNTDVDFVNSTSLHAQNHLFSASRKRISNVLVHTPHYTTTNGKCNLTHPKTTLLNIHFYYLFHSVLFFAETSSWITATTHTINASKHCKSRCYCAWCINTYKLQTSFIACTDITIMCHRTN